MQKWGKSVIVLFFTCHVSRYVLKPLVHSVTEDTHIYTINIPLLSLPSEAAVSLVPIPNSTKVQEENKSLFFSAEEATYSGVGPWEEQAKAEHTQDGTANHPEDFQSHLRFTGCKGHTVRQGRLAAATRRPLVNSPAELNPPSGGSERTWPDTAGRRTSLREETQGGTLQQCAINTHWRASLSS